jgi:hypothetical protein
MPASVETFRNNQRGGTLNSSREMILTLTYLSRPRRGPRQLPTPLYWRFRFISGNLSVQKS